MPDLKNPAFVLALGEMPTRYFCFKDGTIISFSSKIGGTDILIDLYVAGTITAQHLRWGMAKVEESGLPEHLPESDEEQGFKNLPLGKFIQ